MALDDPLLISGDRRAGARGVRGRKPRYPEVAGGAGVGKRDAAVGGADGVSEGVAFGR